MRKRAFGTLLLLGLLAAGPQAAELAHAGNPDDVGQWGDFFHLKARICGQQSLCSQ